MTIRVEFFGIPRQRAGVAALDVSAGTLAEVFDEIAGKLPEFAQHCLDDQNRLKNGFLVNINGQQFTSQPETKLNKDDTILILSADAGG